MKPGCTVVALIHGKPEKRAELTTILASMVEPTRREEGCLGYHFHVSEDDPDAFMFYENWQTRADLDAHLKLPHLAPLLSRADELLSRPVEVRSYTMLSDAPR